MKQIQIKAIGAITKKENLASVEDDTRSNALVLESLFPFPGYHGTTVPDRTDPRSLFLVTKQMYDDDTIIRAIRQVKQYFPHYFDGAPGRITVFNEPARSIRIKYLHYNQVGDLVSAFQNAGIQFRREEKVAEYISLIKITKYFIINPVSEGIFNDSQWKEMYYLQMPVKMDWDKFEEISTSIKHNVEDKNYDAALTHMYDETGVLDFVRIYDEQCCQGKLLFIRDKYLEAIKYL
jgi:hypothetical protein